jgi:hypothetical protein
VTITGTDQRTNEPKEISGDNRKGGVGAADDAQLRTRLALNILSATAFNTLLKVLRARAAFAQANRDADDEGLNTHSAFEHESGAGCVIATA